MKPLSLGKGRPGLWLHPLSVILGNTL